MFDPADPDPDYELAWPRELFRSEAVALERRMIEPDYAADAELLLEEAFAGRSPVDDLRDAIKNPVKAMMIVPHTFFNRLLEHIDVLPEHTAPRPYWSVNRGIPAAVRPVDPPQAPQARLQRDCAAVVGDLQVRGYLDRAAPRDCPDDPQPGAEEFLNRETVDRIGVDGLWPLRPGGWDEDVFYSLVEVVHDLVARPGHRWWHDYAGCGWHYSRFTAAPGRALYRWHVDRLFARHGIELRLAATGEDTGRLVRVAGNERDDLVRRAVAVEADRGTREHAVALFRGRGAGEPEKRSAIVALARLLEDHRELLKVELLSKDEGALFEIANKFDLRHRRADQRGDYAEAHLDWLFWWYLATLELIDQLLARQAASPRAAGS